MAVKLLNDLRCETTPGCPATTDLPGRRDGQSWLAWCVLLTGLLVTGLLLIPRQSATRIVQKPIERFEIFDRVPGRNPQVTLEERAEFSEPDWRTTRIVHFEKLDEGGTHRFRLARSQEWIAENAVAVGSQVEIDLPEQGLTGLSRVVAIAPCPPPKPGSGSLVTGVFEHAAASSLEVLFEGDGEPLNVTSQHPFWSEDRQDFVPIGEFQIGERARTHDGRVVPLTSVTPRAGPVKVHNLEIHGEHVFHAGNLSLLVHNSKADSAKIVFRELNAADRLRLEQGLGLIAKGKTGSVADQVSGKATRYISASEKLESTRKYRSGNGLIAIDVSKAKELGAGFIDHGNVMQGVRRSGLAQDVKNAENALEVMFKDFIPYEAIRLVE